MTTHLEFAGDLAWWQGLILALAGAGVVWRLYRRDVATTGRRWVRRLLPVLRALAMFAVLACLTGPVLTHRVREGKPGRVLIFVDGSQSMGLSDEQLDAGRKLLIASSRGALPADKIDLRLSRLEESMGKCRRLAAGGDEEHIKQVIAELEKDAGELEHIDAASIPESEPTRGAVTVEYFDGIPGSGLADLTAAPRFKQPPSKQEARDVFESTPSRGDNYGTRVRGYLYPPLTGSYTFWINSDDDSQLFIGTDADPASRKPVARVEGFTPYHQWESMPSQKSPPVELKSGQRYYVEALHKEGSGEDYVSVGWTRPDGQQERPIPGIYLSVWGARPPTDPQALARLRGEFENELVRAVRRRSGSDKPQEKAADLDAALARWQRRFGDAFAAYAARLLESADDQTRSAVATFNKLSRWQRAERLVLDIEHGLVAQLSGTHEIELDILSGRDAKRAWTSQTPGAQPDGLHAEPISPLTDLSDGIRQLSGENADHTAVVLLSDGRHNDGSPPLELARFLGARGVPLHAVSLGNNREPPDLAVLEVQSPQSVFTEDRIKGQVMLKDLMPAGSAFTLTVSSAGRELWKRELNTNGEGLRRIEFDFAAKDAAAAQTRVQPADVQVLATPVQLQATVSAIPGENKADNNGAGLRLNIVSQGRRILLIDGRPRWETRFIRDLFARDRQWQLDPLIQDPAADGIAWSKVDGPGQFPADRDTLFGYGLVILGELPLGSLQTEQLQWIRDFVEKRGGGLILLDGPRGFLREYERTPLGPLIPIGPTDSFSRSSPDHFELTVLGGQSAALRLENDAPSNSVLWRSFPRPHWVAPVRALEGTETLAEVVCTDDRRVPALVHRRVGAGDVLYCAFDESWRWRYEVADQYQTKYWNQLANWLMETPFAVKDRFVAIDAGGPTYQADETARLRVQLSDRDGKPLLDAHAEAVLYRDGSRAGTIPLEADPNRSGLYRAVSGQLEPGDYEVAVSVAGFSDLETKARATFAVEPRKQSELAEQSCDEDLLRAMAAASGGTYLREEDAGQLLALLKPLSEGKIVVTETRLAQSFWWFVPIVLILSVEWIIRKRIGLM